MATLAFCVASNRRDLENARIVTIITGRKAKTDVIIAPCDNDKSGVSPDQKERERITEDHI